MSLIAAQPVGAVEPVIKNSTFWPDISPAHLREVMRIDGTVTNARLSWAIIKAITFVNGQLAAWQKKMQADGNQMLEGIAAEKVNDQSILVHYYESAVYAATSAILQERLKNFDATGKAATPDAIRRSEDMARDLRREATWAIHYLQGKPRMTADLL